LKPMPMFQSMNGSFMLNNSTVRHCSFPVLFICLLFASLFDAVNPWRVAIANETEKVGVARESAPLSASLGEEYTRPSAGWYLPRGNTSSQGVSFTTLAKQPRLLWEFREPTTAFEATPVLADGVAYIGDLDGGFYALRLSDGEVQWRKKFEDGFSSSPAYRNGKIIVGDYEGLVRCIEASSGETAWTFSTDAQIDGGANFFGELVLVTSEDGSLYALNFADGKLAWKYTTGDQLRCGPTIAGTKTFLAGCDGKLHVVDLDSGKNLGDGFPLQSPTGATPGVEGDVAYVPTHSGTVFALSHTTLKQNWCFEDQERSQEIRSSPAIFGDRLFVTTRNKRLLAIDRQSGSLKWEYIFRKRSDASPLVCDGRVWIGSSDGKVVAIDLESGMETWSNEQIGAFNAGPSAAAGKLVIANDKGSVYCFGE
jgi:outer membrane protein assembly factor BamB